MTQQPPAPSGTDLFTLQRVSEVSRESRRALWQGRLPLAGGVILDGDGGLGKSTLAAWIAAHITTGRAFPGDRLARAPGLVLYLTTEDTPDVFQSRVVASGGNPSLAWVPRMEIVDRPQYGKAARAFTLPAHVDTFRAAIRDIRREEPSAAGPVLVIVDPLIGFLDADYAGKIGDPVAIRNALDPVLDMAEDEHVLMLFLRHINKATGLQASMRGLGSVDFRNVLRSQLMVVAHPDDPSGLRALCHEKVNQGVERPTLQFRLAEVPGCPCTPQERASEDFIELHVAPQFLADEIPRSEGSADMLLGKLEQRRNSEANRRTLKPGDRAASFLRGMLQGRPEGLRSDVLHLFRNEWDICSKATLDRVAKDDLHIEMVGPVNEDGKARYYWRLPQPPAPMPPDLPPAPPHAVEMAAIREDIRRAKDEAEAA